MRFFGIARAGKIDDDLIAFLPHIDRGARIGELHDHPAGAVGAAPEIDGADRAFGRDPRLGGCRRARRLVCRRRRPAAVPSVTMMVLPSTLVVYGIKRVDIDDQARAAVGFGREHRVDAAGAHVDAARGEAERGIRQVERDARRLVDGERQRLRRRAAHVQFELHLLTRQV